MRGNYEYDDRKGIRFIERSFDDGTTIAKFRTLVEGD